MARQTGRLPDELQGPEIPPGVTALWMAYAELGGARGSGGFAGNPISHRDLVAYQELYGVRFTPWEAGTILALDRAVMAAALDNQPKKT